MYNVLIKPLVVSDAEVSWKWRNDPEVWQYTGARPTKYITYEIENEWLEKVLADNTSKRFAILVDDEYVGNIQLSNIEENLTAEYHIFIGNKSYWGKGIASLATNQIIRYAKTVLNLEKLYLRVHPDNVAAIKVYEKCNFKKINEDITMCLNLLDVKVPKVSVFMMVYNHEKYIEEALKGVLMQKCNFDYEIVIGEDCSIDGSRNIILKYYKQFPGKFKLLLHNSNIGAQKNQLTVLENCSGQYIAICEGDDYWTDPLKLQKQVDVLENNPEYKFCITNLDFYNQSTSKFDRSILNTFKKPLYLNIEDFLVKKAFMAPCTWLGKRECFFLTGINEIESDGSFAIFMDVLQNTKVYFLDETTSVYRILQESASRSNSVQKTYEYNKGLYHTQLYYIEKYNLHNLKNNVYLGYIETVVNIFKFDYKNTELSLVIELIKNDFNSDELAVLMQKIIGFYQNKILIINNSKSMQIGKLITKPLVYIKNIFNF